MRLPGLHHVGCLPGGAAHVALSHERQSHQDGQQQEKYASVHVFSFFGTGLGNGEGQAGQGSREAPAPRVAAMEAGTFILWLRKRW
jgi:hypothetical protein